MSKNYISSHYITAGETIIMGLSGGPDSVFLLHQLIDLQKSIPFTIIAAHLNHEWRKTALRDELFCKELCQKLNITFITKKISELDIPAFTESSLEAQGRYYRKYFLETLLKEYNATKIFLAHHQDDQVETFFIKLIRGASCEGLGGLKSINKPYYRPLLHISKETIITCLHDHNILYVHDESNEDTTFLRNAIRHKLIPVLQTIDKRSIANSVRAIESIKESNDFIALEIEKIYSLIIIDNVLHLKVFNSYPLFVQKKVLLSWLYTNKCEFTLTTAFIDEILRFFASKKGGTHHVTQSWSLIKKHHCISIYFI